jgi:hypothetical protein
MLHSSFSKPFDRPQFAQVFLQLCYQGRNTLTLGIQGKFHFHPLRFNAKGFQDLTKEKHLFLGLNVSILIMAMTLGAAQNQNPVGPGTEGLKDMAGIDLAAADYRYPMSDSGHLGRIFGEITPTEFTGKTYDFRDIFCHVLSPMLIYSEA